MKKILTHNSRSGRLGKLDKFAPRASQAADIPNNTVKLDKKVAPKNQASNFVSPEETRSCICNRKPKTLVCINCKMFTYGRISQKCLQHVNVTFLMDFNCCPNCLAPKHLLRGVDVDHGFYQDINAKTFEMQQNISY